MTSMSLLVICSFSFLFWEVAHLKTSYVWPVSSERTGCRAWRS